jgi:hypothetical protein
MLNLSFAEDPERFVHGWSRFNLRLRTILAIGLTVTLASVVSCSSDEPQKYDYFRVTVDGQQTLGISSDDALVRGVIIFFHDVGANEFAMTADQSHADLTAKLVNSGFAVVSSTAGGDAWGNASSQRNYLYAGGAAANHYRTENVFFLAEGMGAIAAANVFVTTGPTPRVRGFAAINPILDLSAVAPQYMPAVAKEYPGESIASANPMTLPVDVFQGRKMRFYVSPADSVVPADANARAFQSRLANVADVSIVECSGPHGDASCFQGDDLVKWFTEMEKRS